MCFGTKGGFQHPSQDLLLQGLGAQRHGAVRRGDEEARRTLREVGAADFRALLRPQGRFQLEGLPPARAEFILIVF